MHTMKTLIAALFFAVTLPLIAQTTEQISKAQAVGLVSRVEIRTEPDGASINLDGMGVAVKTPAALTLLNLSDHPTTVSLSLPGYETLKKQITVTGTPIKLLVRMVETGCIEKNATPVGASQEVRQQMALARAEKCVPDVQVLYDSQQPVVDAKYDQQAIVTLNGGISAGDAPYSTMVGDKSIGCYTPANGIPQCQEQVPWSMMRASIDGQSYELRPDNKPGPACYPVQDALRNDKLHNSKGVDWPHATATVRFRYGNKGQLLIPCYSLDAHFNVKVSEVTYWRFQ